MVEQVLVDEFFDAGARDAMAVLADLRVLSVPDVPLVRDASDALYAAVGAVLPLSSELNRLFDVRAGGGQVSVDEVVALFARIVEVRERADMLRAARV